MRNLFSSQKRPMRQRLKHSNFLKVTGNGVNANVWHFVVNSLSPCVSDIEITVGLPYWLILLAYWQIDSDF